MYPLYYMALHGDYFLVPPKMWENFNFPQLPCSAWERAGKDDDPGDRLPRPRQHLQQHHQQHPEGLYPLYSRWLIFSAPKADGLTAIEMFMIVNIIFVFCALIGIKTAWIQCQCKILSEYAVILFSQKIKTSQRPKIRKAAMRSSTEVCKWLTNNTFLRFESLKPPQGSKCVYEDGRERRRHLDQEGDAGGRRIHTRGGELWWYLYWATIIIFILGNNDNIHIGQQF